MSAPTSKLYICSNVRLNSDYIHSIYFPDIESQENYFSGKVVYTFSDYTYLRKSWNIKVNATMVQARKWNYLYFINDTKRWYYFITNIEYKNDQCVELTLELDVIQTYMFDWSLSKCFIEREHVKNDEIGANLVEEDIEIGEIITFHQSLIDLSEMCILIMSTFNPNATTESSTTTVLGLSYHGVFSGVGIYAVPISNYSKWSAKLCDLDRWGKSDGIISMWMYPSSLVQLKSGYTWSDDNVCKPVQTVSNWEYTDTRNERLSGYSPRNNKLYCYPYNFLYVSNNTGGGAVYKYEHFTNPENFNFRIAGALSPDANVFLYPRNYKGCVDNYDEGLTLSGFPTCAWNQDVYKLWLAQNQNQQNMSLISSGLKIGAGILTTAVGGLSGSLAGVGGGAMTSVSGVLDIQNMLAQRKDKEIQPPQAKGGHSVSVNVALNCHTFVLKQQCVTKEYANIIDGYFDLYGYAVKQVKLPSLKNRKNWTYLKTVGCHVYGNFCVDDKKKIERIFDNGITFWVNGDSIGNYSLENTPI